VHLYGRPAPIAALAELGLPVVEDAAQAHGLRLDDRPAGSVGVAGCFSFYPTKNLGAFGDAGAVVTSDETLAARIRELRVYGESSPHYARRRGGANSRLDELQAALLRVRLSRLERENARRSEVAASYDTARGEPSPAGVHHLYVIRSPDRDELRTALAAAGVETAVHYPWAISDQAAFADARPRVPVDRSRVAASEVLSLPCHPHLGESEVEHVAAVLRAVATAGGTAAARYRSP
ncbi:MAG: DegT/DnrJ/EryC1/StrS family aminotransferase, partial [Actinomycetota bacterium]|nr:DegT/DnrJ/EryC1/StrS family aminotransferase [Actinomycetota bacterium]